MSEISKINIDLGDWWMYVNPKITDFDICIVKATISFIDVIQTLSLASLVFIICVFICVCNGIPKTSQAWSETCGIMCHMANNQSLITNMWPEKKNGPRKKTCGIVIDFTSTITTTITIIITITITITIIRCKFMWQTTRAWSEASWHRQQSLIFLSHGNMAGWPPSTQRTAITRSRTLIWQIVLKTIACNDRK